MKTAPSDSGQRANCVGLKNQQDIAVPSPFRIRSSRDGHPLPVQPGHGPAQGHRLQTASPESGKVHRPAQFRKPRPQPKTEPLAPLLQPTPPAPHGVAAHPAPSRRLMHGTTRQQPQQYDLLNRPAIPALGRDTFRQSRTGLAAALAKEPGDGDRMNRTRRLRTPVCFARITAVPPKPGQTAMRTGRRPIDHGLPFQSVSMLLKGQNRRHNPLHRPVSFVRVESFKNFPR
jgi:hypothetical protein